MLSTQRWMVAVVGSLVLSWSSLGMAQGLPDLPSWSRKSLPAVVNISTSQKAPVARSGAVPGMPDLEGMPPMFREFFERGFPQQGSAGPP